MSVTRRDFLKLLTNTLLWLSGVLGLGGVLRFLGYADPADVSRQIDLGPADDYPPGSRTLVADGRAVLVHDEHGFHAITTICTHLGCLLNPTSQGFVCPCHGSRFDLQGGVLNGPAAEDLPALPVELAANGHLLLSLT